MIDDLVVLHCVIIIWNPNSEGIDFSCQNLTSNVDPPTVGVNIFIMVLESLDT